MEIVEQLLHFSRLWCYLVSWSFWDYLCHFFVRVSSCRLQKIGSEYMLEFFKATIYLRSCSKFKIISVTYITWFTWLTIKLMMKTNDPSGGLFLVILAWITFNFQLFDLFAAYTMHRFTMPLKVVACHHLSIYEKTSDAGTKWHNILEVLGMGKFYWILEK